MSTIFEKEYLEKSLQEEFHGLINLPCATHNHLKLVKSNSTQPKKATTWVELLWDALQSGQ